VHPRGEFKKFNIARGESKKNIIGGKNKTRLHYRKYQPIYLIIYLILKKPYIFNFNALISKKL
jgi:hypothetical protein